MHKDKFRIIIGILIISIGCLQGCANNISTKQNIIDENNAFISMETEAKLSYDVPKSVPHIIVDQLGYLPDHVKQAFFFGDIVPETFSVVDADSGKKIFTGEIKKQVYSDDYNANIAIGDFSDITTEGSYYIEAELLGKSFDFEIRDKLYKEIFNEALRIYYYNRCGITITENLAGANSHNACHTGYSVLRQDMTVHKQVQGGWHQDSTGSQNIVSAANVIANLLLSYELYPTSFLDDIGIPESGNDIPDILDEVKYEADWFLKMQDENSGAVYSGITVNETNGKTISYVEDSNIDSAYAFSFALAKFSYIYQKYDKEYATICLKAADRAWKYAVANEDTQSPVSNYKLAAAAEIYRASGLKQCKKYLKAYFSTLDTDDVSMPEYYGWITYLNTTQEVNVNTCDILIGHILKHSEEISKDSRNSIFLVDNDIEQLNNTQLLDYMLNMVLVDYVITNHEYDKIIDNYLHYFLGRNKLSITYIDKVGTYNYKDINEGLGIMKQFENNSKLIFLLSKVNL